MNIAGKCNKLLLSIMAGKKDKRAQQKSDREMRSRYAFKSILS